MAKNLNDIAKTTRFNDGDILYKGEIGLDGVTFKDSAFTLKNLTEHIKTEVGTSTTLFFSVDLSMTLVETGAFTGKSVIPLNYPIKKVQYRWASKNTSLTISGFSNLANNTALVVDFGTQQHGLDAGYSVTSGGTITLPSVLTYAVPTKIEGGATFKTSDPKVSNPSTQAEAFMRLLPYIYWGKTSSSSLSALPSDASHRLDSAFSGVFNFPTSSNEYLYFLMYKYDSDFDTAVGLTAIVNPLTKIKEYPMNAGILTPIYFKQGADVTFPDEHDGTKSHTYFQFISVNPQTGTSSFIK